MKTFGIKEHLPNEFCWAYYFSFHFSHVLFFLYDVLCVCVRCSAWEAVAKRSTSCGSRNAAATFAVIASTNYDCASAKPRRERGGEGGGKPRFRDIYYVISIISDIIPLLTSVTEMAKHRNFLKVKAYFFFYNIFNTDTYT
jgi:hypothetical protein